MTIESIKKVEAECKRVLAAAKLVTPRRYAGEALPSHYITTNKHSGALRRASLDLTRALADMRKP